MFPRSRRLSVVVVALGLGLTGMVAWVAAAPPARSGGLGLHFFSRKSSETSNKPPADASRNRSPGDAKKSAAASGKRSTASRGAASAVVDAPRVAAKTSTALPDSTLDKQSPADALDSGERVLELPESPADDLPPGPVDDSAEFPHAVRDEVPDAPRDVESPDEVPPSPLPSTRSRTATPRSVGPRPARGHAAPVESPGTPESQESGDDPLESPVQGTGGASEVAAGLTVAWSVDGEMTLGESRRASLVIHNSHGYDATDVVVRAVVSESLEIVKSTPERERRKQISLWRFERIPAGATQSIDLVVRGVEPGDAGCVANVTCTQTASRSLRILRPELKLAVDLPETAASGDPVSATVTLTNAGRGTIREVVARLELSAGLMHARGRSFEVAAGALTQGESRKLRIPLSAVLSGSQELTVVAQGTGTERCEVLASLEVTGPQLTLNVQGPAKRFVDRRARYQISVHNEGSADSSNLRLRLEPPAGFDFAEAGEGGAWDAEQRVVEWFVAELAGGRVAEVSVDLVAREPGTYTLPARLMNDQGLVLEAEAETVVDSTPRLVVTVEERDDPVEVGLETAWEIRLRNDGSRPSLKNRVFAEMPAGVRLVEATGPTRSATDKELVAFAALAELRPGAEVVYTLRVVGLKPGSQRIKVRVNAAESEPLTIEETTQFYSDR